MKSAHVIGIDFGTDSVRSLVVSAFSGEVLAEDVRDYPRWSRGLYCDAGAGRFRQHPLDYLESFEETMKNCLERVNGQIRRNIRGIFVDTTGSTPVAVDRMGIPLAMKPGFEDNPNAMFILWKDHTAVKEAEEINFISKNWGGIDYTRFEGGVYSSEWFWSKILHIIREDAGVREHAYSWVEHCDWFPALLTGNTDPLILKRSRSAAGHKAMWHEQFGGLPSGDFLVRVDPLLAGLRERLYRDTYTSDLPAGQLTREWAGKLNLPHGITVGVGALDGHIGAAGGGIEPFQLTMVMGTSISSMLVIPSEQAGKNPVKGICGQVDGSIIPGLLGLEAGQSAFGDVYAWFRDLISWPVMNILQETGLVDKIKCGKLKDEITKRILPGLTDAAEKVDIGESGIVALDWLNGRRTPDANPAMRGALTGLNLGTDAPKIFRALVESTAFGSKKVLDTFLKENIRIDGAIALGGVAKKSPFILQVMADVLNMSIRVARSEQATALGAAMFASVAAGIHDRIETAQKAMGAGFDQVYMPDPGNAEKYKALYHAYNRLGCFVETEITERPGNSP